jgi:hypothetical protein
MVVGALNIKAPELVYQEYRLRRNLEGIINPLKSIGNPL